MNTNKYTMKQKMELTEQVNELIKQGLTKENAIKNVGISEASFYRWNKLALRKAQSPRANALPAASLAPLPKKNKLALFVGSVDDILECYRRLS